jgi:hypothetical protein
MKKKTDQGGETKGSQANNERTSLTKHDRYEQKKVGQ